MQLERSRRSYRYSENLATSAGRNGAEAATTASTTYGLNPGMYEITVTSTGFAAFKARAEVSVGAHNC